jgi:ABC-type glycerol-3-phosphate transport system substrate-binding protein
MLSFFSRLRYLLAGFLVFLAGCSSEIPTLDPKPDLPFRGVVLKVGLSPNMRHPELFKQFALEWSRRNSATVTVGDSGGAEEDILILPPAEIPNYVERGLTTDVPDVSPSTDMSRPRLEARPSVRNREHPYQWDTLVGFHAEKLSRWNNNVVGIPLLGEGHLLIYRKDILGAKPPPATWEQFVEQAEQLHKQMGKPTLPPLPKRADDLETEFYTIAASFDRAQRNQTEQTRIALNAEETDALLSFQYRLETLKPRINSGAFVKALTLMQKMQMFRSPAEDTISAFQNGSAVLGLATLEDLALLQAQDSPLRGKIGIAEVPGSDLIFNIEGEPTPNRTDMINRIPYVGWGGWYGVVTTKCADPSARAAAWEMLGEFGNADKNGAEIITAGKWGAGPFRLRHTDQTFRNLWLGYNLSFRETDQLMSIMRRNLAPTVVNYRVRLRTPNQNRHMRILTEELSSALAKPDAKPNEALNRAAQRWEQLWEGVPHQVKQDWIEFGLGLSK